MRLLKPTIYIILFCFSQIGFADTLSVEKWGSDSGTCGTDTDPCATIQQAIDNASMNDTILVGPGTYTENINIDKEGLKVRSVAGRYATMIIAAVTTSDTVRVLSSKVQFGRKGQGFTVSGATGSSQAGLDTGFFLASVKIEGNRFTGNRTGLFVRGDKHQVRYNVIDDNNSGFICTQCDELLFQDNVAMNSTDGVSGNGVFVSSTINSSIIGNLVSGNTLIGINIGILSTEITIKDNVSEYNGLDGIFVTDAVNTLVQGNITANSVGGSGMTIDQGSEGDGPTIKNNLSVNNLFDGFLFWELNSAKVTGNTAIGNGDDGIDLFSSTTLSQLKNNNTWNSTDCGIENDSGSDATYTNHFFGDAAGPNPPGSNDNVCGSDATTGSFATEPNAFKAKKAAKL